MPDPRRLVINTGPISALTAALDDLSLVGGLFDEILVPNEVQRELQLGAQDRPGWREVSSAGCFSLLPTDVEPSPYLRNSLDRGEAAVIQAALD